MSAAVSPSASPRLPSPPPIPEDQTGPASPSPHATILDDASKLLGGTLDNGAARRIRPGTRSEDIAEGPPLVELSELDSAFQLTEHLKALHFSYTHPADTESTIPVSADLARQLACPPPNTSKEIWLYELGRFLIQKTNSIIVALFADYPPCSSLTCPEMRASEWQYLCAVHDPPKSCSAIDYCCHTLDWAASTLTSSKMFPSRLGLGSGNVNGGSDKMLQQQMKEITNIFRRVYRIYAHAWFQHRDMFWRVEGKTGLYVFFKTVCDEYGMIQSENYTIPPEAEGLEPEAPTRANANSLSQPLSLLRKTAETLEEKPASLEVAGNQLLATGDTTKRHRSTRSDASTKLTAPIQEETEDEEVSTEPANPTLPRQNTVLKKEVVATPEEHQSVEPAVSLDTENDEPTSASAANQEEESEGVEETIVEIEPALKLPEPSSQPKAEAEAEAKDEVVEAHDAKEPSAAD